MEGCQRPFFVYTLVGDAPRRIGQLARISQASIALLSFLIGSWCLPAGARPFQRRWPCSVCARQELRRPSVPDATQGSRGVGRPPLPPSPRSPDRGQLAGQSRSRASVPAAHVQILSALTAYAGSRFQICPAFEFANQICQRVRRRVTCASYDCNRLCFDQASRPTHSVLISRLDHCL
jgi:hypothetical protein